MRIILLGSPGAGKGTLAAEIKAKYPVVHISTGDIFRENVKDKTPLGKKAKNYLESGQLVPDDIVIAMMEDRLVEPDCAEGFILDGFPRTVHQAEMLEKILGKHDLPLDAVVLLDIEEDTVVKRLSGRRVCRCCGAIYNIEFRPSSAGDRCDKCGGEIYQREDDEEKVVRSRLNVYYQRTRPVIAYYDDRKMLTRLSPPGSGQTLLEEFEQAVCFTE